ncbi:MAG: PLD nuclease N-terminal domain-containing protein [Thermomicrobiales bacterium]
MSWQTWLLATLIVLLGLAQYGLMAYALRDLVRRPTVRGDNKVTWALVILTLPFFGALIYTVYGPTSFIPRANRPPTRPPGWEDRGTFPNDS